MRDYYLADGETVLGPLSEDQVRGLVQTGAFGPQHPVCRVGEEEWHPLGHLLPHLAATTADFPHPTPPAETVTRSLPAELAFGFLYPLSGLGWMQILFFTLFTSCAYAVWLVLSLGFFALFGMVVLFLLCGYGASYLIEIIQTTAAGDRRPPNLPSITDFWDDALLPGVRVGAALLLYLGPALYFAIKGSFYDGSPPEAVIAYFLGWFFLPMAFLRIAIYNNILDGVNPIAVFLSTTRVFLPYLFVFAALTASTLGFRVLLGFLVDLPWYVLIPTAIALFFYSLMVQARHVGVIYLKLKHRLGWFE
ncbi:MAG: DUF4339 domain-containing protein [Puniceicoccaceae bacterium]|nr:MAG: DUF4339 domain-containing protein [Puniceicoccaceae bacterium]